METPTSFYQLPPDPPPPPTVCRIVLYCDPYMGDEYPAIVTAVYGTTDVGLTTFAPNQPPFPVRGATPFNTTDTPVKGTWRWPPRSGS